VLQVQLGWDKREQSLTAWAVNLVFWGVFWNLSSILSSAVGDPELAKFKVIPAHPYEL